MCLIKWEDYGVRINWTNIYLIRKEESLDFLIYIVVNTLAFYTDTDTVSKNYPRGTLNFKPASSTILENVFAKPLTRLAISYNPFGPWYTAYMPAILANSA